MRPSIPGTLRRLREQHLRLRQDGDAGALEVAEQALAVGHGDAVVALHQRTRPLERLALAVLLKAAPQLPVERRVAPAQALDGPLRLLLEVRLPAVEMVETARGLACQLDVRDLVLADRHVRRAIDEDVGALQQRIAEKAVGGEVLLLELLELILVGRDALQPAERGDHGEQQVQLRMLRHVRLDEERRDAGIQARGQPVDQDLAHELRQARGVLVAGGQHVPVGDEEEALVAVLQLHPVAQRAVVVAEVQPPGRPHAREHAPPRSRGAQRQVGIYRHFRSAVLK